jgi:hypothetical protein
MLPLINRLFYDFNCSVFEGIVKRTQFNTFSWNLNVGFRKHLDKMLRKLSYGMLGGVFPHDATGNSVREMTLVSVMSSARVQLALQ